jgi:prophage antirepressor-like protein
MVGTPEAPEWIAADVCAALELRASNPWKHLPDSCKGKHNGLTPGGWQKVITVNEHGLYRLVTLSRIPAAERFRSWLFGEVLPSIRKHGCFPPPAGPALPAAFDLHDPLQLATVTVQALQLVAELKPKADAHDRLSAARGDMCLQDAGRILGRQPNVLVRTLIDDGILFRGAHGKPEPQHEYRERSYFRVRVTEVNGEAYVQTLVTPRGLQWLAGRYPTTDAAGGEA